MDDSKRITSIRRGYDFGDSTPAVKYNMDDHLGSSNLSVDTNGTIVNREEYYPFGETSFGSYSKKRYRFCGKEKDEESGLYYYGARYYSPWTCRFISVDPLAGKYIFQTPYAYADNNPICKMDYNGEGTDGGGETNSSNGSKASNAENLTPLKTLDELIIIPSKPVKPEKIHKADYKNKDGTLDKETYEKAKINYSFELKSYKQRMDNYKILSEIKNQIMNSGGNIDLKKTQDIILKTQVPIVLKLGNTTNPDHFGETKTIYNGNKTAIVNIEVTIDVTKIYGAFDNNKTTEASNQHNVDNKKGEWVNVQDHLQGIKPYFDVRTLAWPNLTSVTNHEMGHVFFNLSNMFDMSQVNQNQENQLRNDSENAAQRFEYNSY
jgi:RHS repeat-associated protein